jgi:peptidoglycan/xylan/chitin deacetylase (PgdA/CDA1 family)
MTNMRRRKLARLFASMPVAALIWLAWMTLAQAADCPRKGTLGTSRILRVDAATYPRVGIKNYPQTLPLRDHEVVLTFDDGPWPPTTPKVLAMLAKECVHATFFLIGKPTSEHPELARRIAAAGHTIGHHTWTHFSLMRMPQANAFDEIDHGISAVEMALHGVASTTPSTPFFRFPGFETTEATLDLLQSRGIVVFGTDLWASDWNKMTPKREIEALDRSAEGGPQGNHSCTTPRRRRSPCCRLSCVTSGTTTITSCKWFPPLPPLVLRRHPDLNAKPVRKSRR